MGVTFKTSSSGDPTTYILGVVGDWFPTTPDLLYAAQRQRTRIIERTLRGVDADGQTFEPYSTDGPYYYYPNGRLGRTPAEVKRNQAAVKRLLRITSRVAEGRALHLGSLSVGGVRSKSRPNQRRFRIGIPHGNGQGIKFDSYADFKQSLGRMGVDLTGPKAPHMLQAIEATADKDSFRLGIMGEPAGRAIAHNTGYSPKWKRPHQRRFFAASASDIREILDDLATRYRARRRK